MALALNSGSKDSLCNGTWMEECRAEYLRKMIDFASWEEISGMMVAHDFWSRQKVDSLHGVAWASHLTPE